MRSARSSEFISSFVLEPATQSTSQSLPLAIAVLPQHKEQSKSVELTARRTALQNTKIHRIHANPQNPRNSGALVLWGELVSPPSRGWLPLSQI